MEPGSFVSPSRSNTMPLVMKKIGIRNPKPMASSLCFSTSGSLIDGEARLTTMPAAKAPRMMSKPKSRAT